MTKRRIGILTGGGDVPGLNSVIKTVTYRSSENDIEVVGLRREGGPVRQEKRAAQACSLRAMN
jgi:6-phosphofructokinase